MFFLLFYIIVNMPFKIGKINKCCLCITDLKSAAAIIAVLGIVTSPAVSWAIVRHSYVIRVSCFLTTSDVRPDVIDINLNNILTFGFGANAGLGSSCLHARDGTLNKVNKNPSDIVARVSSQGSSRTVSGIVKYFGWLVLLSDLVFLTSSINLLIWMFRGDDSKAVLIFFWTGVVANFLSFVYGLLYVSICIASGGSFPLYELAFCIIDLCVCVVWIYFLIIILSYLSRKKQDQIKAIQQISWVTGDYFSFLLDYLYQLIAAIRRRADGAALTP